MICPKCGKRARVIDSRPSDEYGVRRRRECTVCGKRFTTYEITAAMKSGYDRTARTKEMMVRKIRELANKYARGER